MSSAYKIAVASSDEKNIDLSFGEVSSFLIYEVQGEKCELVEKRQFTEETGGESSEINACTGESNCGSASTGCGSSGCGSGGGCGGNDAPIPKLELISDCRVVLCKKIGGKVRKQMEKKAISAFDIEVQIDEALEKIIFYFDRVDNHKTLRGIANRNV